MAQTKAEGMQTLAGRVNNEMQTTVTAVGVGAKRQAESVKMMAELERQAANIGDIVKAVARIADQTNLLALNAAIEATRAGQHAQAVPAELRQDGLVALRYQPEPECFFKGEDPWHLAPGTWPAAHPACATWRWPRKPRGRQPAALTANAATWIC